jgi:hypothetical protein
LALILLLLSALWASVEHAAALAQYAASGTPMPMVEAVAAPAALWTALTTLVQVVSWGLMRVYSRLRGVLLRFVCCGARGLGGRVDREKSHPE